MGAFGVLLSLKVNAAKAPAARMATVHHTVLSVTCAAFTPAGFPGSSGPLASAACDCVERNETKTIATIELRTIGVTPC